jgi:hypothetical protein
VNETTAHDEVLDEAVKMLHAVVIPQFARDLGTRGRVGGVLVSFFFVPCCFCCLDFASFSLIML